MSSVGAQHAPATSYPLPSSTEPPLKMLSHAKHPSQQTPEGTEPGHRDVPRDGHWLGAPGASVRRERGLHHHSGDPQIDAAKAPAMKRSC